LPGAPDVSNAPFSVAGKTTIYYVNDATVQGGDWTTAAGDDAHDGLSPATPKASIRALLQAYDLGTGDVVKVDAGNYALTNNIVVLNDDSGVTIQGYNDVTYPTRRAMLDRGNTAGGSYVFDLQSASSIT